MLKHFLLSSLAFSRSPISKCHDVNRTKKSKSFVIIKKYTYIHRNFASNHRNVLYSFFCFKRKKKKNNIMTTLILVYVYFHTKKKKKKLVRFERKGIFVFALFFFFFFYDETIKSIDWNVKNKTKTTNIYCDDNDMP